jgi:hypothetical protein
MADWLISVGNALPFQREMHPGVVGHAVSCFMDIAGVEGRF